MAPLKASSLNTESTRAAEDRVGKWIDAAPAFAQPIVTYLRELVHEAAPDAVEEMKWSRPFFLVNGQMVCYLAAFTKHCGFGFWSPLMTGLRKDDGIAEPGSSGSLGRITALTDLPPREQLLRYVRHAAERARAGDAGTSMAREKRTSSKAPIPVPVEFSTALDESNAAAANFHNLSVSAQREYLEWITSAKRAETRTRRIVEAVARLAEGRRFNEEYRSAK